MVLSKQRWVSIYRGQYIRESVYASYLIPERALFLLRILQFLYTLAIWIGAITLSALVASGAREGNESDRGGAEFVWFTFTHLSYTGLLVYFLTSVLLSWKFRFSTPHHRKSQPLKASSGSISPKRVTLIEWVHLYLYHTIMVNHLIVTIVFWLFLAGGFSSYSFTGQWLSGSRHAGNLISVTLEFILGAMNPSWGMAIPVIATILVYMFWAWFYYGISGLWVYNFLNWERDSAWIFYVGLTVAVIIVALATVLIHRLRNAVFRRMGKKDMRSVPPTPAPDLYDPPQMAEAKTASDRPSTASYNEQKGAGSVSTVNA